MPGDHAILSPSSASRWLACTPSARLELTFPDKAGRAANEGTLAHKLAETILRFRTNRITKDAYKAILAEVQGDELYQPIMLEYCEDYAVFVLERFAAAQVIDPNALIFFEHKFDLTAYIKEGFGTGDIIIVCSAYIETIDLKYGKGVVVSAERNKQMMIYGLGAFLEFGFLGDPENVRMVIHQPRVDNYSVFEMSVADLMDWAELDLKDKAALAFAGEGNFHAGIHCTFCRARAVCRANKEYNLEIAKHDFKDPVFLEDDEISEILTLADQVSSWLNAVEEHALTEAVKHNKKWPGFKLVEGRSNRFFSDKEKVAAKLIKIGYRDKQIHAPKELLGITALESLVGRKVFNAELSGLIIKPAGKLTLVPAADKRNEHNSLDKARDDFATWDEDEDFSDII